MKKFNNLQELWSNMVYCAKCNDMSRDMYVSYGPEYLFKIEKDNNFSKNNEFLEFSISFKDVIKLEQYIPNIKINCIKNTIEFETSSVEYDPKLDYIKDLINKYGIYFYINAHCSICDSSSSSMEIYMKDDKINSFQFEMEFYTAILNGKKTHISIFYDSNTLYLTKDEDDDEGFHKSFLPAIDPGTDFNKFCKRLDMITTFT